MDRLTFTKLILSILFLSGAHAVQAQNLVPNYSFETISTCPMTFGGAGPTVAPPWISPTFGSPDIYNSCSFGVVGVPFNWAGTQYANSGEGFAGVYVQSTNEYREYIQAPLLEPLQANILYSVSFYVSLADIACAAEWIGAYISVDAPHNYSSSANLEVEPQVESDMGFITDVDNWVLISGCFTASGGEQFITIGNFRTNFETPILPPCVTALSYYFIDDVILERTTLDPDIPVDLGGPEVACLEYEIDPDYDGYFYTWEDGSHGSTLTVDETGVYSLTIADDCHYGVDSIEIFIHGEDPVDLGPEEVVICDGDAYVINLDPNFNEYEWNDGSTDSAYTITTPGTYSVTLDDGCEMSTDEITVEVVDGTPAFDLGEDLFLCFDEEIEFSLDPELGEFHWQDNSTSSDYTIDEPGTYALTITNICGMESDAIEIISLDAPEINIGPDTLNICNGQNIIINIDLGPGEITWQDGSFESAYTISTSGHYSVILTNECGSSFDEMEVIAADSPFVYFGPDTVICDTNNLILSASDASGNFHWQDNSTNDSLVISAPGVYSLTIENFCGVATDTIAVDFGTPVMPPDLGPDLNLCPGEQIVLHVNTTNANAVWQDGSTADSLIVTAAGIYAVLVSNACSIATDTLVITLNGTPPQVALPEQISLCHGETTTLDAGISGVSYLWNDNSSNQQLLVNSPGTYALTVSNTCGVDTDTTIVTDGGPAPLVDLGNDLDICPGETITLSPVSSNVISWLWQDGSASPAFNVSSAGSIHVQVGNSCGNAYDTLLVSLLPATPPLDLGPDTAICAGESFMLSIQSPDVSILWPDGSTAPDFNVIGTGPVYATINNSCGQSTDTIQVSALPDVPVLNLGPDQSLCPGEMIVFDPGIANVQYVWQDGSTTNSYQSTQEENIILIITNQCGASTDTVEIIESTQGPLVDLGADIQVCEGEIVTLQSGISGVNYLWQDGSSSPDYTTTQSGQFILQVNNNCGSDSDTILVDISGIPPAPALGPDTTLCEGVTIILISNAEIETTVEWQDGSSAPTYTVTSAGIYSLAASNRCGDAADTIEVTYVDAPDPFSLGPDTLLCPGESVTLTAPSTLFEIRWQDGSTALGIIADQPGTYTLQLMNDCGVVTDEIQVDFDNNIPQLHLDPTINWCEGDNITLDATQSFSAGYLWNTGETLPSIQVNAPGQYYVDVNTPCHTASQQVNVLPGDDCDPVVFNEGIYIPNVFSPNGDGVNDVFSVSFGADLDIVSMEGSIYDRWGNLVFSSTTIPFVWDGYFASETVMAGVYVYTIKVKYMDQGIEREVVFVGDVTLVR